MPGDQVWLTGSPHCLYLLLKGIERNSLALTGPNTDLWEELLIFKLQQGLASKDIKGLKQLSVCFRLCSIIRVIPSARSWMDRKQGEAWKSNKLKYPALWWFQPFEYLVLSCGEVWESVQACWRGQVTRAGFQSL